MGMRRRRVSDDADGDDADEVMIGWMIEGGRG